MIPVTVLLQVIFAIQHTFAACPESLEGLTKWSELTTVRLEYNVLIKHSNQPIFITISKC